MSEASKRGRGRPAKPAPDRKRNTLAVRVRDDLKTALERIAIRNQRSLSEEAELRLEHSLAVEEVLEQAFDLAFGRQLSGLLLAVGRVMRETGTSAGFQVTYSLGGAAGWMDIPYAYNQAVEAALMVFEASRPLGDTAPPTVKGGPVTADGKSLMNLMFEQYGHGVANAALGAIIGEELTSELDEWGARIQKRLGPAVVERIKAKLARG